MTLFLDPIGQDEEEIYDGAWPEDEVQSLFRSYDLVTNFFSFDHLMT